MTVELREPFVWPEAPKDFTPYVAATPVTVTFFLFFLLRFIVASVSRETLCNQCLSLKPDANKSITIH
jgi:hypothetical protein